MSYTFSFDGTSSVLEANFHPAIDLRKRPWADGSEWWENDEATWVMALLGFQTYHTVPNVIEDNNRFIYKNKDDKWYEFLIPVGAYTIDHLGKLIKDKLKDEDKI